ncbi:hypothetical protein SAMN03159293_03484 [Pseudomonas sp. NFACC39-1]|nr:hypothetical protein SAMN03159293_03484 [Pseudomonas sp. NFACC39-1]
MDAIGDLRLFVRTVEMDSLSTVVRKRKEKGKNFLSGNKSVFF